MPHLPTRHARRLLRSAAALTVSVAVLTACGGGSTGNASDTTSAGTSTGTTTSSGSSGSSGSSTGDAESITATEADFSISLDEDTLAAGTYDIEVVNNGHATHDLVVERNGKDVAGTAKIQPGESATLTVTLESGNYVFYCSIGTHRAMGMETEVSVS